MRTLAYGTYTAEQVAFQLHSSVNALSSSYLILDRDFNTVGELNPSFGARTGVNYGLVDWNFERSVFGTLRLRMMPDTSQLTESMKYQRYIKPYIKVRMQDGGEAKYALGVYVWDGEPERTLAGIGDVDHNAHINETWVCTLGDQRHLLDITGPGTSGFGVSAGTPLTTLVSLILDQTPVNPSRARITASSIQATQALSWTANTINNQPLTWLKILESIHLWIGYNPPWFDADGVYVAEPQPNIATATAEVSYRSSVWPPSGGPTEGGLLLNPVNVNSRIDGFANRVTARSQASNVYTYVTLDGNDLFPHHPLRQATLGFYVDQIIDVPSGQLANDLTTVATAELGRRMFFQQELNINSLMWPVHEAFEVVGFRYDGDNQFDSEVVFFERGWSLELTNLGIMKHLLRRIYQ